MLSTSRKKFMAQGFSGLGISLLAACSGGVLTLPGSRPSGAGNSLFPSSDGQASVSQQGNEVLVTASSGKVLFSARITNTGMVFTDSQGVVSALPLTAFAHSSSYTLNDGTKLAAQGNGAEAVGPTGITAFASISDKNEMVLSIPSRGLSVTEAIPTANPSGVRPMSCASAKEAYASACIVEAAACLTAETGIGFALIIAAALAVASTAQDMKEQCG